MRFVIEDKRRTPVICQTDVLVVGGGVAGVAAAVAARRVGVNVILTERYPFLGGLATGGNVLQWPGFDENYSSLAYGGIPLEVVQKLRKRGAALPVKIGIIDCLHCDPEILKYVLEQLALESGVKMIQHVLAVGACLQGSRISAVIFEGKSGRVAIGAKIFIDATGDADLVFWSGGPFKKSSLPISLAWNFGGVNTKLIESHRDRFFKQFQKTVRQMGDVHVDNPYPLPMAGTLWCNGTYFKGKQSLSPFDLTEVGYKGRQRAVELLASLKKRINGFQDAFLFNSGTVTGVRASRQLNGQHVLTMEDIDNHAPCPDSIGLAHTVQHPSSSSAFEQKCFQISYRCLVPKKVDNLLVAGRCISVTPTYGKFKGALEHVRGIPQCMVTGQAAGCAGAIAGRNNLTPSQISIAELRHALGDQQVKWRL